MVKLIAVKADKIIAITPHNTRAEAAEELLRVINKFNKNCEAMDRYEDAFNKALSYSEEDDMILIAGSLSTIGEMKKIIKNSK